MWHNGLDALWDALSSWWSAQDGVLPLLLTQLPANAPGTAAGDGSSTYTEGSDGIPGSWLCSGPASAVSSIGRMTQQMQDISADLPFKQFFSKLQEDGVSYRQILHHLII